jgi:glycerate dehydrogenase
MGREVARLASAFGCEVRYFSTSGTKREEAYAAAELDELLAWSDIVSVHSPLNEHTRGLVGERELRLMKPSAMIINVARGGIIDEAALAEALNQGWIAAAALDVFSVEPLRESPLYGVKDRYRLLASPHNAWSAAEAIDRLIECVAENIRVWSAKQ